MQQPRKGTPARGVPRRGPGTATVDGGSYPAALLLRTPRGGRRFPDFQDFRADGRRIRHHRSQCAPALALDFPSTAVALHSAQLVADTRSLRGLLLSIYPPDHPKPGRCRRPMPLRRRGWLRNPRSSRGISSLVHCRRRCGPVQAMGASGGT